MLLEIKCDLFHEKTVTFHKGLNVILGDDKASNSIGKSTMLMIIDYVFGGDSYVKNKEIIKEFGEHSFKFTFRFGDDFLYFIRNTEKNNIVSCCDENYIPLSELTTDNFRKLLKEKYEIPLQDTSFREIVGLYSRIWGKDNYDTQKPLQENKQTEKDAVDRVIKLFDKYTGIKSLNNQVKDLTNKKDFFKNATKIEYLPNVTATLYKDSLKKISEIDKDITKISNEMEVVRSSYESIVSKEILDLKRENNELLFKRNLYEDRLKNVKINLITNNPVNKQQFTRLVEFFPGLNLDKLESINKFHSDITSILKGHLTRTQKELEELIQQSDKDLHRINQEIDRKLGGNDHDIPRYIVDRLVELTTQKNKYQENIRIYDENSRIKENLKSIKIDVQEIKTNVLAEINQSINSEMNSLNKLIHTDGRQAPYLELKNDRYSFTVLKDSGTGKAYSSLLTLDLAIFSITLLPFIIHDSMLFKNIEINVMNNIISIYNIQEKQVFIAIDESIKYDTTAQKILKDHTVLELSANKTLFGKSWNKTKA